MRLDWFFPSRLALRMARNEVGNREAAYLMLANLVFNVLLFYSALTWANPPWMWLSLLECLLLLAVSIHGFTRCYFAAGGDENRQFIWQVNCLWFGAWFWSTAIVWSVYWSVLYLFHAGLWAAYRFEQLGLAKNLAAIGGSFDWFWTLLAAVMWQVILFALLAPSLAKANAKTGSEETPSIPA